MKISKINVEYDYGTAKRRTGLNSPAECLHEVLKANYIEQATRLFKGYTIGIQINNSVYVADCPHEMLHRRLKTDLDGRLAVFCPLGRQQAEAMTVTGELTYLCTAEELAKIKGKTDGNRIEVVLKRAQHTTFAHHKEWYEGGGECRKREVKFFNLDKASGAQARVTNVHQMAKVFKYDYSEFLGEDGRYF
jgi:hypothetical protein